MHWKILCVAAGVAVRVLVDSNFNNVFWKKSDTWLVKQSGVDEKESLLSALVSYITTEEFSAKGIMEDMLIMEDVFSSKEGEGTLDSRSPTYLEDRFLLMYGTDVDTQDAEYALRQSALLYNPIYESFDEMNLLSKEASLGSYPKSPRLNIVVAIILYEMRVNVGWIGFFVRMAIDVLLSLCLVVIWRQVSSPNNQVATSAVRNSLFSRDCWHSYYSLFILGIANPITLLLAHTGSFDSIRFLMLLAPVVLAVHVSETKRDVSGDMLSDCLWRVRECLPDVVSACSFYVWGKRAATTVVLVTFIRMGSSIRTSSNTRIVFKTFLVNSTVILFLASLVLRAILGTYAPGKSVGGLEGGLESELGLAKDLHKDISARGVTSAVVPTFKMLFREIFRDAFTDVERAPSFSNYWIVGSMIFPRYVDTLRSVLGVWIPMYILPPFMYRILHSNTQEYIPTIFLFWSIVHILTLPVVTIGDICVYISIILATLSNDQGRGSKGVAIFGVGSAVMGMSMSMYHWYSWIGSSNSNSCICAYANTVIFAAISIQGLIIIYGKVHSAFMCEIPNDKDK